jgi:hypothetical protein
VFGGVFDRFPWVRVILGHMGETLPFFLWRLDQRAGAFAEHAPEVTPSGLVRRNVQPEQRRAAGRRRDRAGDRRHRGLEHGGLEHGGQQPAICGRRGGEGRRAPARRPGSLAADPRIYHHALATGFSRGYLVSAGVLVLPLVVALFMMRVSRADLSGADPTSAGDADSPNLA